VDGAEQEARQALAAGEEAGDRFAVAHALYALSFVAYRRLDQAAVLSLTDQALEVAGDDPQMTDLRILLLSSRAVTLGTLDRHAEADRAFQEALTAAEQAGTPQFGIVCVAAAEHHFAVGQWDEVLTTLEMGTGPPGPDYLALRAHGLAAVVAGHRDDSETAKAHLTAVQDLPIDSPGNWAKTHFPLLARALDAERAGRPDDAVAVLAPVLEPGFAADMPELYKLLPTLVRLALTAGDTATAAAAAQAAEEEAERGPLPVRSAAARWCGGLAAGDPEPVLAAVDYYQEAGRPLERALALEDAAVLLAGRDELARARAAFRDATRVYQGLGAAWDLRRADARLRRYGIHRGRGGRRQRPARGWEALTPTEAKIVSLVAAGRSNPDIAAELYLSRNTVQTHVSHILAKLGAHSRAEIIRQALEHAGHAKNAS
jgi:DNA-binding CsgD family transcriptional regulator